MARIFRTTTHPGMLLRWAGMIAICTLASGLCTNFEITRIMCEMKGTCNKGVCNVNIASSDCSTTCDCYDGYEGEFCNITQNEDVTTHPSYQGNTTNADSADNATTSVTPNNGRENQCGSEYVCEHGQCLRGRFPCTCYLGWAGPLCNRPCNLTCINGGNCKINSTDHPYCNCPLPFTGPLCELQRTDTIGETNNTDKESQSKNCGSASIYVCDHGHCDLHDRPPCICDEGWRGPLCNRLCNLTCMNGGSCLVDKMGRQRCGCEIAFTGNFCELVRTVRTPGSVTSHQVVELVDGLTAGQAAGIGVAAVVGVIILVAMVIFIYIMCKRNRTHLLSWCLRCCSCRFYEDEDCASYDALLWYKDSALLDRDIGTMTPDEHMALRKLLPKLEGELGYKVCLPFRDFSIDTQLEISILNAVRTSRRIILVMSNDSIKDSVWLQPSYRKALSSLLGRRKRVIIINVEEMGQAIDSRINALYKSARIVEWPSIKTPGRIERFWLQLELTMPKVHHVQSTGKGAAYGRQESCFSACTEMSAISISSPSEMDNNGYIDLDNVEAGVYNNYSTSMEVAEKPVYGNAKEFTEPTVYNNAMVETDKPVTINILGVTDKQLTIDGSELTDKPLNISDDSSQRSQKEEHLQQTADAFEQILAPGYSSRL